MGQEKKDVLIQIRISSELKEQAKDMAERNGRTLSNYITQLIKNDIENHNLNKKKID